MSNFDNKQQDNFSFVHDSLFTPEKSGFAFSVTMVALLLVSVIFSMVIGVISNTTGNSIEEITSTQAYIYSSFIFSQLGLVIALLYLTFKFKLKPRNFGLKTFNIKYMGLAILISFGLLFSLSWVNDWFIVFMKNLGYTLPEVTLPDLSGFGVVWTVLVIAVLPAIFEELVFRGVITEGLKSVGTIPCVLLCGLAFSLFHQSPSQTIYQFICGAIFALIAIRSGSVIPSMIIHFLNNAVIIIMYACGLGEAGSIPNNVQIVIYILSAISLIIGVGYLIFLDKSNYQKKQKGSVKFLIGASVGLVFCIVMWIVGLFS